MSTWHRLLLVRFLMHSHSSSSGLHHHTADSPVGLMYSRWPGAYSLAGEELPWFIF